MIKSDAQLKRTLAAIDGFKKELEAAMRIEDDIEREIACSGYRAMLQRLLQEKARYENAKHGLVYVPTELSSILQLCPYLTDIRIALGWTQEFLASRLSVTRQAVNKWEEHEYQNIDVEKLQRIVDVMGLHTLIKMRHDGLRLRHHTEESIQELEAVG